jgi:capsular exopolysaccharide synthesis family protein
MNEEQEHLPIGAQGQSGVHSLHALMHFVRVVRFRFRTVLMTMAAMGVLGGLYYATTPRLYQSKASLLVMQNGGDVTNVSLAVDGMRQNLMPTYERLFSSAVVLDDAIASLSPEDLRSFNNIPKEQLVSLVRQNLTANTLRQTNIIELGYRSNSPQLATAMVNAVLHSYLEFLDRTHKGTAGEVIRVLTREKAELEQKLANKEQQVLEQRRRFGDLGIRADSHVVHPLVQRAISLNDALMKAQQARLTMQSTLSAIQLAVRNGEDLQQHMLSLENAVGREFMMSGLGFNQRDASVQAAIEKSLLDDKAELKALLEFYGPQHPRVIDVTNRVRNTENYLDSYQQRVTERLANLRDTQLGPMLLQIAQQRLGEAREHEAAVRTSFEHARQDAVKLNGDIAKLEILEHDLTWLRNLRDVLLNQIASIDVKQDRGDVQTAVVSEPTLPRSPTWPKLPIIMFACGLGGSVLGLALVYVIDILDDRFRSPEELRAQLGAPVLAMVRQLDDLHVEGIEGLHVYVKPDAVETEAFRTLRTALAFSGDETSRLVISSSEPGDGKTTVLANLACSFAQSGKRTLLIDADMRRPGLTNQMGLKGQPGLSDLLISDEPIAEIAAQLLRPQPLEGLDFIPAGPRRPNPAEMLSSARLADLVAWAEGEYDQILIDSPPALAATDSSIIGRLVDGIVLVVQPRKNQRRLVMRAAEGLTDVGVNLVGVVVNRIGADKEDKIYGYGGSYGYGYGYGYGGYGNDSEDMSPERNSVSAVSEALAAGTDASHLDDDVGDSEWPRQAA